MDCSPPSRTLTGAEDNPTAQARALALISSSRYSGVCCLVQARPPVEAGWAEPIETQ